MLSYELLHVDIDKPVLANQEKLVLISSVQILDAI